MHPPVRIGGRNRTWLFRRRFSLKTPPPLANLRLFADGVYHLWVNGEYIGRGPVMHHPTVRPFDTHDLSRSLNPGENVIAILTHTPDISLHNYVPVTQPSLIGSLDLGDQLLDIDSSWRATDQTGWQTDVPRRSWALGYVEHFDARHQPDDWRLLDFDDSAWQAAAPHPTPPLGVTHTDRPTPPLRYAFVPLTLRGSYACAGDPVNISSRIRSSDLGHSLLSLSRSPLSYSVLVHQCAAEIRLQHLSPQQGVILTLELDQQKTGQVVFRCESDTPGTIDIGYSETFADDLPQLVRKGVGYCDRVITRAGITDWQPINYSSMRHVMLVLRGFSGSVSLHNTGVRSSEPDLDCCGTFQSDHAVDQRVFSLSARSHFAGTQDAMLDCPTREQAAYVGDGVLTGRWLAMLTGDTRHWAYVVDSLFTRPFDTGLFASSIFSGAQSTLIDYTLLGVIGLRDYWLYTRDTEMVRRHIEACRRAISYLGQFQHSTGLFDHTPHGQVEDRGWETAFDPDHPRARIAPVQRLFIDHPGMGWHNVGDPGIDRNGLSGAYNALLVLAWRAVAELEQVVGVDQSGGIEKANKLAKIIHDTFFDTSRGVYVDAARGDARSSQVSEQTNTWAIAAGCCDRRAARKILSTVFSSTDPTLCRGGPYFWAYILPLLADAGLHALALERVRAQWGKMLNGGATLLWETFAGDDLDSWCHAWSGAPIEFYLTEVAGLPGLRLDASNILLRPRPDLISRCTAQIQTRCGPFSIQWHHVDGTCHMRGRLPEGTSASLELPDAGDRWTISGEWSISVRR